MSEITVGDKVQWTQRKIVYGGYVFSLREGTIVDWDGAIAIIKTPTKYAKRVRVHVSQLAKLTKQEPSLSAPAVRSRGG